jgi:hypothetical protein
MFNQLNEAALRLQTSFDNINTQLDLIQGKLQIMANQLDALTAQVTANDNLLSSAIQLIDGIAAQITAAGLDPAKLTALTTSLQSQDAILATAILANTPVVVEGSPWVATQIYNVGDTVTFTDGNSYTSNVASNVGNSPSATSTFWSVIPVVTVPSAAVKAAPVSAPVAAAKVGP